jgi:catechol-2,3-dioxygenase
MLAGHDLEVAAMSSSTRPASGAMVNHLVLNVRDIEASHRFYTEVLGFERCAELDPRRNTTMWFYRGKQSRHHDLALVQVANPEAFDPPRRWSMAPKQLGINHMAISYPDREAFLAQLEQLRASGVEFLVRGNHGMTHSVYVQDPDGNGIEVLYELPNEVWEHDVNGAMNYFELLPTEGPESMVDSTDYARDFTPAR